LVLGRRGGRCGGCRHRCACFVGDSPEAAPGALTVPSTSAHSDPTTQEVPNEERGIDADIVQYFGELTACGKGVRSVDLAANLFTGRNSRGVWYIYSPINTNKEDLTLREINLDLARPIQLLYENNKDVENLYFIICFPLIGSEYPFKEKVDKVLVLGITRSAVESWNPEAKYPTDQFIIFGADKRLFPGLQDKIVTSGEYSSTLSETTVTTQVPTTKMQPTITTTATATTKSPNKFIVYWGHTGDKVHISPTCRTITNGYLSGTLDECKSAGHTEGWCQVCSKGWSDERFLREGNPLAK